MLTELERLLIDKILTARSSLAGNDDQAAWNALCLEPKIEKAWLACDECPYGWDVCTATGGCRECD